MPKYKLTIEYDGTNFVGWQSQDNGNSIQQSLEEAIKKLSNERVTVYGAGRTDSGVHAKGQVAHFEISAVVSKMTLIWKVQNVLNAYEPTAREIYPGLNNDYVWIRNNRDFYPMGQLISFSVLWNFEN